jgi:phospholipid transport system substrate-binding protein
MALSKSLALIGALLVAPAFAEDAAPDALMKRVSDEVTLAIRQQKDVRGVVEAKILPHVDARRVTQSALGAHWRRATPEQQEALVREFTALLVRTYSGALASYRDQTIEFLPLRAGAGESEVTVRSRIRQPGAESIMIEYDLAKGEAGWKVYDVRVAGISLVATYRTTFAEEVRNRGIDGLINTLAARNRVT